MSAFFEPVMFATEAYDQPKPVKQQQSGLLSANEIVHYLEEHYSFKDVPDDLAHKLSAAHNFSYITPLRMSTAAIDGIVLACREWAKYLSNPKDFDRLVFHELVTMAKCHTSVLSSYFTESVAGFKLTESKPGLSYALIVDRVGNVKAVR